MIQTKLWGIIYACRPRGSSLQILGSGARQKPAYIGRGWPLLLAQKCGAEHGVRREAGPYRSRMRKLAWGLMAPQDILKMESSFPVTLSQGLCFLDSLTILLPSNKNLTSFSPFLKSGYLDEISRLKLYLSKGSPISSLLAGTLNPIEYSPAVLKHSAYSQPLITYKIRGELWTSVYLVEKRTNQQRNHQKVKIQVQQESPHKQKEGQT